MIAADECEVLARGRDLVIRVAIAIAEEVRVRAAGHDHERIVVARHDEPIADRGEVGRQQRVDHAGLREARDHTYRQHRHAIAVEEARARRLVGRTRAVERILGAREDLAARAHDELRRQLDEQRVSGLGGDAGESLTIR